MQYVLVDFAAQVDPGIPDEQIDLLVAALTFARAEYPDIDIPDRLAQVALLASRAHQLRGASEDPAHTISCINTVLFREDGFAGNQSEFYDPRNSYLNEVLDRKLGIPISLSVIYMEVARRLGLPLVGVGLPGHFLLKFYDISGHQVFIDPFSAGRLLTPAECQVRLDEVYGGEIPLKPEFLHSVSKRQILTRMLSNLRSIYIGSRNFKKALTIIDFILAIHPRSADDLRQSALLRYNEGMLRAAIQDLEEYLQIAPDASDAEELRQTALSIRRFLAMMN